jgi:hypothetical protein
MWLYSKCHRGERTASYQEPGRTGNLDKASGEEEKPAGQNGRLSDDFNRLTSCAHRENPPLDRLSDEIDRHGVERLNMSVNRLVLPLHLLTGQSMEQPG